MTSPARRSLAAGIAAVALIAPLAMSTSATATPGKKPATTKTHTKQLLKAISVKDAQLARIAAADRTTRLADDHEAAVVSNIGADRATLAELRTDAEAVGSTLDSKAVRKELHDFRVVNYVLSGNILRQAERVEDELAADPEAAAHLEEAITAALAITAESTKSDVRDAREQLRLAKGEVESDEDEVPAPVV